MDFEAIKSEYFRLRTSGVDAKSALSSLRANIVGLEMRQREKLLEQLRLWEIGRATGTIAPPAEAEPKPKPPIKPLSIAGTPEPKTGEPTAPALQKLSATADALPCPRCGKLNRRDEILCGTCGQLLSTGRSLFDTRHFVDAKDNNLYSDEYFGPESTLVLVVTGTQETFKIRPQDLTHEVVIGRGAGATMHPDIDLSSQRAAQLGVSRLHLTVHYNEKQRTLSASDMDSANGTFINGQRLYPEEVRILRHGDEMRLGKLTLTVYFYPNTPADKK